MVEPNELGIGHLFGRVRDAVIVGDAATGKILLWNPGAQEVFGYTRDQATAMSIEELVPPALREQHRAGLRRFAASDGTVLVHGGTVLELPALHQDGRELVVELTLTPLEVRPERPLVLAIIRDVTARRAAERSLEAAQAATERANESLRDFIAMVAHDLRGPLTAIGGFVALLGADEVWGATGVGKGDGAGGGGRGAGEGAGEGAGRGGGDTGLTAEDRDDILARTARQVRHMEGIIGDLLAAIELEAGTIATAPADVEVSEAVAQAIDACGGIEGLHVACQPGLRVRADPAHVVRAVANVLQNARKHGRPPVTLETARRDANVEIRVSDQGEGLLLADQDRIFDRFARGTNVGRRPGLGLGLAIVRGLVEANGGSVWYEPNVPSGAVFVLRLPLATG